MNKIILYSKLEELKNQLDEITFERIRNGQIERLENHENAYLISFDWYDIFDPTALPSQLILYFSEKHLFFICEEERLLNKVTSLVTEASETDKMLITFFGSLMSPDMDFLEGIEEEIEEMENNLLINTKAQCTQNIVLVRKKLLRLKKYYEQLDSIFFDLVQNENEFICTAHLRYFTMLYNRINRLMSTVNNLRDFLTHVREAYQAQIDIEQNATMKVFTVITSVFLPLSLIVGWYGMNLQMPEFSWPYAYPTVILFSVLVCVTCLFVFKLKKWF